MPAEFVGQITEYEYQGDIHSLGSLQLTELAQAFEEIQTETLDEFFPDRNIIEREVVIEQIIEGLGIMPPVRFGVPSGGFVEDDRIRRSTHSPVPVREDDFLEEALINQLRKPGTMNEAWSPLDLVARRVQKLVNRHKRTMNMFKAKVLLGGINYNDPRTNVSVNVSTNIPTANLFSYSGWNGVVASGDTISISGAPYTASKDLVNDKGRTEAALFTSTDGQFAVPWIHPRADIVRTLQLIKQFFLYQNKIRLTDIVISSSLLTAIQSTNEYLRTFMGLAGVLVLPSGTNGQAAAVPGGNAPNPAYIQLDPSGEIRSLAGLQVRTLDGMFRNPVTGNIETYWPANKVALVARRGMANPSETLGRTDHPSGEAPGGAPGVYMRVSDNLQPPQAPGRVIQMGDAFLPYAIYPHWIGLLEVCELGDVQDKLILETNLGFGTF